MRWTPIGVFLLLIGCGSEEASPVGEAQPDAAIMEPMPSTGASWFVDTYSGRWVQPEGAERILSLAPGGLALWLSIHDVNEGSFDFMLAVGEEAGQDHCTRTIVMPGVEFLGNQRFRFGPRGFSIPNGTTVEDLVIEGRFNQDFTTISDLSARGRLVLSSIPPDILPGLENIDPCEAVYAVLDTECVPCADGSVDCLEAEMIEFVGAQKPSGSITAIEQADCHEQCDLSSDNADCEL